MGLFSRNTSRNTSRGGDDRRNDQAMTDEQAVERYRYMLRTAPPDQIEQAHEEAFERLTPEQRRMALEQLSTVVPRDEMRGASDDPRSLARLATRTEVRQPGMLERLFGGVRPGGMGVGGGGFGMGGMGMGIGGMLAGSLLASVAGTFIGSAIAHSFFDDNPFPGDAASGALDPDQSNFDESGYESAEASESMDTGVGDSMDGGFDGGFDGGDFGDV